MTVQLLDIMDNVRKSLNGSTCRHERSRIGQFLTPVTIARFMASLFELERENVRVLDAGAGAGVLFAALVETLISSRHRPFSIEVIAYENDRQILPELKETMNRCENACKEVGITFQSEIRTEDFITAAIKQTEEGLFAVQGERFTHAILNPPYKKINGLSTTRRLLDSAGIEVSNLYAAFVWLSARMLTSGGELVAITPRSFCNGPYFRRFRFALLDMISLRRIHVFESRKKAFGDDDVLQENVIYYAVQGAGKPERLTISSSEGAFFENATIRSVPFEYVVLPDDRDAFIHLVKDNKDNQVMDRMGYFTTSLDELRLDVSTGRVVDFRAREYLRPQPEEGTMPLVYPSHFQNGFVNLPLKVGKKPSAIVVSEQTEDLMVESGYYVLTKRFSSKEERRRVVAAIYDPCRINAPFVGFENHLNYFHAIGVGLSEILAKGLALYLNTSLFDRYFRLFSGHTQVNATDLKKMHYPSREQLIRLGAHVKDRMPDQETIDVILEKECKSEDFLDRRTMMQYHGGI
ncbi:MAG: Eco57I restriction-modification methylase domain-containing protein [Deltaproteobacteria bacterium]|nr:Eco57I restriction-modification methylase domain-containing protein [Deltaproteobacteria bacterium]